MKYLLFTIFFLTIYGIEQEKLTCWDICSRRCRARYGQLTENCVKECTCPCDKECDSLCVKFNLGNLCRSKCGCYQSGSIKIEDEEVEIQPLKEEIPQKKENEASCAKECTNQCVAQKASTMQDRISCLEKCKCEKKSIEQLLQSNFIKCNQY